MGIEFLFGVMKIFWDLIVVIAATYEYMKNH